MSSTHSHSGRNTPVEQRIYSLSNVNSTETINTASIQPALNSVAIPQIRILLAPYMSPYLVPVHKVKTWDNLQCTLARLFSIDIFGGSSVQITDHQGEKILRSTWSDVLAPNMTIIVGTCSYTPESPPSMFAAPRHQPIKTVYTSQHARKGSSHRSRSYESFEKGHGRIEKTTLILAERESEDSSYENVVSASPLGQVGQSTLMAPPNSLKSRPMHAWEGWRTRPLVDKKRNTSVSMIAGRQGEYITDQSIIVHPSVVQRARTAERQPEIYTPEIEERHAEATDAVAVEHQDNRHHEAAKPKKSQRKLGWAKITRALMLILSRGQNSMHRQASKGSQDEVQKCHPAAPQPEPSPNERRQHSISHHEVSGPTPFDFPANSSRRSKSVGSFLKVTSHNAVNPSPVFSKRKSNKLTRSNSKHPSQPARGLSVSRKPLSRSTSEPFVISPPIPRRPSTEFGLNSQFMSDKDRIDGIMRDRLDGSTLGSSRSRRGTASTDATVVETVEKPLPKVPVKYKSFLLKSPPRPVVPMRNLPEADRRPPTTKLLIERTPTVARQAL